MRPKGFIDWFKNPLLAPNEPPGSRKKRPAPKPSFPSRMAFNPSKPMAGEINGSDVIDNRRRISYARLTF